MSAARVQDMDLTTRRETEGAVTISQQCVNVNGADAVVTVNGEVDVKGATAEPPRKSSSFSIRHLVGAEDADRPDGNANVGDGKSKIFCL